jgi:hypothetical protein
MKNNFSLFIVLFFVVLIGGATIEQMTKEPVSAKAQRLDCQKKVTSFEKGFDIQDIKMAQKQLENGNYTLSSYVEKSVYMESQLFNHVKLSKMDTIVKEQLKSYIKEKKLDDDNKLNITYYIYENDKKHPGKKTEKSKLYAGYVVFKFKTSKNKLAYQSQIDFMDMKGSDIPQAIKCAIKSFVTYN